MKVVIKRFSSFIFVFAFVLCAASIAAAQTADDAGMFGRRNPIPPKTVQDMLYRMQSEKIKKEYDELLERGERSLSITNELSESVASAGVLSSADRGKLSDLEKLVKKIRDGLGGDDDGDDAAVPGPKSADLAGNVKFLNATAEKLLDELKRSTRFSISVDAIEYSNSLLRTIRSLQSSRK